MSKPNFTPGPWGACGSKHGKICQCGQVWSKTADHPVATVERGEWGDSYPAIRLTDEGGIGAKVEAYMEMLPYGEIAIKQSDANAHLIATAPEMYDALLAVASCAGKDSRSFETARKMARKALAKARGESK